MRGGRLPSLWARWPSHLCVVTATTPITPSSEDLIVDVYRHARARTHLLPSRSLPRSESSSARGRSPRRKAQARPFDPKRPMHLVLRSSRAKGDCLSCVRGTKSGSVISFTTRLGVRTCGFIAMRTPEITFTSSFGPSLGHRSRDFLGA